MKTLFTSFKALILFFILVPFAFAATPVGTWTTISDKDGKPRGVVKISEKNNVLYGTLIKKYSRPGDTGKCMKCPGHFKGKPVIGLTILWGMKKTGANTWSGGRILDPKNGRIYRAKMTLSGNKLYVRGYVGVSLLGRTQTWIRK